MNGAAPFFGEALVISVEGAPSREGDDHDAGEEGESFKETHDNGETGRWDGREPLMWLGQAFYREETSIFSNLALNGIACQS